jgi:hypothetical protein
MMVTGPLLAEALEYTQFNPVLAQRPHRGLSCSKREIGAECSKAKALQTLSQASLRLEHCWHERGGRGLELEDEDGGIALRSLEALPGGYLHRMQLSKP